MKISNLLFGVLLSIFTGCTVSPPIDETAQPSYTAEAEYRKIMPDEAQEMMGDNAIILDVRTEEEFAEGHIKNAVLLPDYGVKDNAEKILDDKDAIILVYCRTGRRSENAAKELVSMGYTNVYDFGGIVHWTGEIVK